MVLDFATRTLSHDGVSILLTPFECRFIELVNRFPSPLPQAKLVPLMWTDWPPADPAASLTVQTGCLRRKMGAAGMPAAIRKAKNGGYAVVTPVQVERVVHPVTIPTDFLPALRTFVRTHPDTTTGRQLMRLIGNA